MKQSLVGRRKTHIYMSAEMSRFCPLPPLYLLIPCYNNRVKSDMGKRGITQVFPERFCEVCTMVFFRFKRHVVSVLIVTFGLFALCMLIAWGNYQGAGFIGAGLCAGYYAGVLRDHELAQVPVRRFVTNGNSTSSPAQEEP